MKNKLTKIGRYEVIKTLGKGGMGTVYLCRDDELERSVAVKLLHKPKTAREAEAMRQRFLREAYATAGLQHPGIPPVYSLEEMDGERYFYTMKPIDGRSLDDILSDLRKNDAKAREEYNLPRLVQILHEVCQTIRYAHYQGFIHRDLKPANIFVGGYGDVYVIDWGLSKSLKEEKPGVAARINGFRQALQGKIDTSNETVDLGTNRDYLDDEEDDWEEALDEQEKLEERATRDTRELTMHGDIIGTLAYMPPEQASGDISGLGKEADIYALGVILYEMLTLDLPVESTDLQEVITLKQLAAVIPPEQKAPQRNIPPELSAITMQAMNPSPDERFRSVAELDQALTFFLEGRTQFRQAHKSSIDENDVAYVPKLYKNCWHIKKNRIITVGKEPEEKNSYLLFEREFPGDVRVSLNMAAEPTTADGTNISEFALVLNAALPTPYKGFLDCYSIHLAASNNTRAYLARHDSEIASNEHVVLEPRRRYSLTIDRVGHDLRVMLNRQVILFARDRDPVQGLHVGFLHRGPGITYSNIRIQTRGMPTLVSSSEVPEALMAEGCYEAALRRFLAIAQGQRDRLEGAWARYRAGIAAYRINKERKRAVRIWFPLKKGHYAAFEKLGRASLELERNRLLRAAEIIAEIIAETDTVKILEPIADIAFTQVQQLLRTEPKTERSWKTMDAWTRIALVLANKVEDKKPMAPSVLWRWLFFGLTRFPEELPGCVAFLRENFGTGQGAFAHILTTIEPLMTVLQRSAKLADHPFLVDRIMRLILSHDDSLANLETLARFYLHSGHEDVALTICRHIVNLTRERKSSIPAMPLAYLCCMEWLKGEREIARKLFALMAKNGNEWSSFDGKLLQGLDIYERYGIKKASQKWHEVRDDRDAEIFSRDVVAKGLLGELPCDPESDLLPQRLDYRRLYCLFVGYKYFVDWRNEPTVENYNTATRLLLKAHELVRPSYDIYCAADSFARIPLLEMGHSVSPDMVVQPLSETEVNWLEQLTVAATMDERDENTKRPSARK